MHTALDDALQQAQGGDERGFTMLFREFQPRLLRYLRTRVGDAAQDVASETWARAIADLHKFHGDADDFAAWLFTIARYRAIDAARAAVRRPVALPEGYDRADPVTDVEGELVDAATTQQLLALVRTLPPDQADAVALRIVAGLDVPTVAKLLGKSDNAVRVCTHRGLRRLEMVLGHVKEEVAS